MPLILPDAPLTAPSATSAPSTTTPAPAVPRLGSARSDGALTLDLAPMARRMRGLGMTWIAEMIEEE